MEIKEMMHKIPGWINKYKFVLLILVIGFVLMVIPKSSQAVSESTTFKNEVSDEKPLEDKLESILSDIEGVGSVRVMLTILQGEEVLYQTDDTISKDDVSAKEDKNTVTITDASRNQHGLIRQKNPPEYLGAIIAFQGADDPILKYKVTEAVAKITGLGANQISVLKMK